MTNRDDDQRMIPRLELPPDYCKTILPQDDDHGVGIDGVQVAAYRWLADRVGHTAPILVVVVGIIAWCLFF